MVDRVTCTKCGARIVEPVNTPPENREPCPKCGSNLRNKEVSVEETIRLREYSKLEGEDASGKRTFRAETGESLFRQTGKYNLLDRRIDWRNNQYSEKIVDGETGRVIVDQSEPLTSHRGHGSAKRKKRV